jgi:spoIIIJ-associated protein
MLNQDQLSIIKQLTEQFFEKACFDAEVKVSLTTDETVSVNVEIDQPQVLIGEKGQTLAEIQFLLRIILRKKIDQPFYFDFDINNYKGKKQLYLKEMATCLADEVSVNKKEKILPAMSSYERKIIHSILSEREDVITESTGQEPERKIVIKPKTE